ncbi:MAG: MiaB/RimO family radical SAM methylthiotransferase, partial [Alphaproteobacteria bacterium]|nr:MiaB/RimO family radical SAM methylthiotransferase [Alphaproteobacteria bacterium]
IVTGCAAQIDPDHFAAMDEVDHVIGNDDKMHSETFARLADDFADKMIVKDIMTVRETAAPLIDGFGARSRAFVQVQNGCDHRCTFCIIPFGRGPARSVPAGVVVDQVKRLVETGYREVVLTGVDLTSYGVDLPGSATLGLLTQQILRCVPELERLRLSSIDQVEADGHLFDAIASDARLMPHFHLSMQSGDDLILKRMKRRHQRQDAIEFCNKVRSLRPDVVFGADLIAGFPTETDAMFANTERLIDECGLTYLHVFPFSPRSGTPAARMPQLERRVVKSRAERLRAIGAKRVADFLSTQVGQRRAVLMERESIGRTEHFAEIEVKDCCGTGNLQRVNVTATSAERLIGEVAA